MEQIQSIEEFSDYDYEGYLVKTNKQAIKVAISSGQSCCENYGYFATNDNLEDFLGATLLEIELVDEELKVNPVPKAPDIYDAGGVVFVNFLPSKGTMQLAVYNSHNSYYGNSIKVESKQLNKEDSL